MKTLSHMLPGGASDCRGAEPITIAMTADHWQTKEHGEFFPAAGLSSRLDAAE